ncbi:MAG: ABC transporter ATP-binding protein [Coriobacteriales bacterium]|jgi:ABC-2 type transport system ATP-binding protein/lipopolysaccharide transport system ATP-binding protein|nr:ABC transporter ATP-binding protein [Coriobacteriales bacterium]
MRTVIEANKVSMRFRLYQDRPDSLKELLIKLTQRQVKKYDELVALSEVSFKVYSGDVLGIVGLNGSGKSTLLKLIAGILKPTEGTLVRTGAVSPLIELGAGFDMDLTARENVFLNGAVLGFSKASMAEKYDGIIEFAELVEFQDVPIKSFSSGMLARLGFSIATSTQPEILIVDEILGVGDFLFKEKSENRILDMMSGGTTVLLVSHSIKDIEKLCTRAIWLDKGIKRMDAGTDEVCSAYKALAD